MTDEYVTIYRYEHPDTSSGPYWTGWCPIREHNETTGHPNPWDDCNIGIDEGEICGFKDKKQLVRWFNTQERRELKNNKYEIVKYRVPSEHIKYGNRQVVFKENEAIKLS